MSAVSATTDFTAVEAGLLRKAAALGQIHAAALALAAAAPQRGWRRADLLWPTFTKGSP